MAHSTGNNIDDIPLAPIYVEESQQPEASTSQQNHNSDTSPMVESVADDGYRLQRRQKNKPPRAPQAPVLHRDDPGITDDPEVKKTAASSPTASANEKNAGKESAPKANTETRTKAKKKKLKFKTFAQLAASERYRLTRAAYDLLNVGDDDGSEGEIEGGSEEHPPRRLADGEIEPPGGENVVEDMDVDEADRGARESGHSDTELSIGNDVAVLANESPAVRIDGEETPGECTGILLGGQAIEGNSSPMHEVLTNWMKEYGGHHVKNHGEWTVTVSSLLRSYLESRWRSTCHDRGGHQSAQCH
ncbi:hypothetical protein PR001_g22920 [Phytophthora rubi]|nr:hypothetical protein PR001_g22920 [Phytophthora rubi]